MPGWTVLFALLALSGLITTMVEFPRPAAAPVVAGFVFSILFIVSLLARFTRRRA